MTLNTSEDSTVTVKTTPRRLNVQELLRGQREMILVLHKAKYRLRITGKGELALTE